MLDTLVNKKIILASASPRRQELFKQLQLPFKVQLLSIDETYPENLKEAEITEYLAAKKAAAFDKLASNEIVITADTIVWIDNKALEKPNTFKDAVEMLQLLSGKKHKVITSVCIKSNDNTTIVTDETLVYFKELKPEEIRFYINNFMPFDKAGSYGIQEWIGLIGVTKIEGSYFNVMGLPVQKLFEQLQKL